MTSDRVGVVESIAQFLLSHSATDPEVQISKIGKGHQPLSRWAHTSKERLETGRCDMGLWVVVVSKQERGLDPHAFTWSFAWSFGDTSICELTATQKVSEGV